MKRTSASKPEHAFFMLARFVSMALVGRVRFQKPHANMNREDAGETFVAFRKIVLKPAREQPVAMGAVCRLRFHFRNLSARANRRLSLIPIPLIVSQPGFRSKTWLVGKDSGDFMGYYEFESLEDARAYRSSLPIRLMGRRAAEGSFACRIFEQETAESEQGVAVQGADHTCMHGRKGARS